MAAPLARTTRHTGRALSYRTTSPVFDCQAAERPWLVWQPRIGSTKAVEASVCAASLARAVRTVRVEFWPLAPCGRKHLFPHRKGVERRRQTLSAQQAALMQSLRVHATCHVMPQAVRDCHARSVVLERPFIFHDRDSKVCKLSRQAMHG
eukprot:358375-Chlamydomonas_euryale.AAC.3